MSVSKLGGDTTAASSSSSFFFSEKRTCGDTRRDVCVEKHWTPFTATSPRNDLMRGETPTPRREDDVHMLLFLGVIRVPVQLPGSYRNQIISNRMGRALVNITMILELIVRPIHMSPFTKALENIPTVVIS